jgi:hypothetical protein
VTLQITSAPCTLTLAQAAAGVSFGYRLTVAADVSGVVSSDAQARCVSPGANGVVVAATITGNGQAYCPTCDLGRCAANTAPSTAKTGAYDAQVAWNGRNWQGPSDTNAPPGVPFPPGTYTVAVVATGTRPGDGGVVPFTVMANQTFLLVVGDGG